MNKWEDLLKQRIHNSKVKAAKSIVFQNASSQGNVKHNVSQHIGQSSLISNSEREADLTEALKKHGLQQYSRELSSKGYLDSPKKLRDLIQSDRLTTVDQELKLLPGHKTKLIAMLSSMEDPEKTTRQTIKLPQLKLPIEQIEALKPRHKSLKTKQIVNSSRFSEMKPDKEEQSKNTRTKVVRVNRQSYKIIISSSSKNLRPAIKRGISKLDKSRKKQGIVDIGYTQQLATYRSIDGARFHSSMHKLDLNEIVECMAHYVFSHLDHVIINKHEKKVPFHDSDLFHKVKIRKSEEEDDFNVYQEQKDYTIFHSHQDQNADVASIGSFIKNVVTGARMEPYLVPAACIFINRLRKMSKNILMTNLTYQKIVLCSLILAGKLYNDLFLSKPINIANFMPSHKKITSAERLFLAEINYDLVITPQQYAGSYFQLRGFIKKDKNTLKNTNVSKCYGAKLQSLRKIIDTSKNPHKLFKQVFRRRSF